VPERSNGAVLKAADRRKAVREFKSHPRRSYSGGRIRTVLVRSLAFIFVLVALGVLGGLVATLASGAPAAASPDPLPTTANETTTLFSTQTTTIVQTTTVATTVTVTVSPRPVYLLRPKDGAAIKLSARQLLRFLWLKPDQATYYDFQLYRGTKKILNAFSIRPWYTLAKRWTYLNKPYALSAGTYKWYVWPGLGMRSARAYGALLGSRTFRIVP
jgi:hypothetical protein